MSTATEATSLLGRTKASTTSVRRYAAAYVYPISGIGYFLVHPYLWSLVRASFLPLAILAFGVNFLLFFFAYLPQVAWLAIWHGKQAWFSAAVLVLLEGAVTTQVLFEAFLVDRTLMDMFDAVMISKGFAHLVATKRVVYILNPATGVTNPVKQLGPPHHKSSAFYAPFSFPLLASYVLFFPLFFIPYVGVPLALFLWGRLYGPIHAYHYLKLQGVHKDERKKIMAKERNLYLGFGFTAICLQMIPVLAILFLMTTAAGSALWAAAQEKEKLEASGEPHYDPATSSTSVVTPHPETV